MKYNTCQFFLSVIHYVGASKKMILNFYTRRHVSNMCGVVSYECWIRISIRHIDTLSK